MGRGPLRRRQHLRRKNYRARRRRDHGVLRTLWNTVDGPASETQPAADLEEVQSREAERTARIAELQERLDEVLEEKAKLEAELEEERARRQELEDKLEQESESDDSLFGWF